MRLNVVAVHGHRLRLRLFIVEVFQQLHDVVRQLQLGTRHQVSDDILRRLPFPDGLAFRDIQVYTQRFVEVVL